MFENLLFITLIALFYTFMPTYFFHQIFNSDDLFLHSPAFF